MHDNEYRLFLAGGCLGLAIFKNAVQQPALLRKEVLMWNPALRLKARLLEILSTGGSLLRLEELLFIKSQIEESRSMCVLTETWTGSPNRDASWHWNLPLTWHMPLCSW